MATSIATHDGATEIVVFQWTREHGDCYECSLPAAFFLPVAYGKTPQPPNETNKRCAVCAASAAADGETVQRLFSEF